MKESNTKSNTKLSDLEVLTIVLPKHVLRELYDLADSEYQNRTKFIQDILIAYAMNQ